MQSTYESAIIHTALKQFWDEPIPDSPPDTLPVVEHFRRDWPDRRIFAKVDALFIQHHLGPLIPRVRAMMDDGLDAGRCWFVDIPYSTNPKVHQALRERLGCPAKQAPTLFDDPLAPYSPAQVGRVAETLLKIVGRNNPRQLLVVDDGAYFARGIVEASKQDKDVLRAFQRTHVVEQTTRGHRYLHECAGELIEKLELSVVSIARCETKKQIESPFIGASVARAVRRCLPPKARVARTAVLGFGPVGQATVKALLGLPTGSEIDVVEPDTTKHPLISALRGARPLPALPAELPEEKKYGLVLGCTGYNSFKLHQRTLLANDAILVSGSSAAVEFNRAGFVELADKFDDDEIMILARAETTACGIHAPIRFQQEGKKVFTFANAGFPANFDGRMECLPMRMIQATHALMFAASRQALQTKRPGLHSIEPRVDTWLRERACEYLGRPTPLV